MKLGDNLNITSSFLGLTIVESPPENCIYCNDMGADGLRIMSIYSHRIPMCSGHYKEIQEQIAKVKKVLGGSND